MKRKIIFSFLIATFLILIGTKVQAKTGIFNLGAYKEVYKLSEQAEGISLPFINVFEENATYDKDITNPGITFSGKNIDVTKSLTGMQYIIASDTVTISGTVENALIIANNVVIEGKVTGDVMIIAPSIFITEDAVLDKDVVTITETLEMKGIVKGNLVGAVSKTSFVSGIIEKDFRVVTENVNLNDSSIKGNVYIETNSDASSVKAKYPNATVVKVVNNEKAKNTQKETVYKVVKIIIAVAVYTAVCYMINRKENNIGIKLAEKLKKHGALSLIMGVLMVFGIAIIPIVLIILAVYGLGVIAWPLLIAYIAILLFAISTSVLVSGTIIYELIAPKIKKLNVLIMASIFAGIYILQNIPYVSGYVSMIVNLISIGTIFVYIFKNDKTKMVVTEVKEDKEEK